MTFKRSINKSALLATAIGGIVGSGWLFGPFYAARIAGPAAIISWILAGLLMIIIAFTFVILTRSLPIAGGTVRFFQLTHGHFVGFSFSWIAWLAWVSVTPIETLALLQYATNYMPFLMKSATHTKVLSLYGYLVAIVLMVIMYTINVKGIKWLTKTNFFIVILKLAIPIVAVLILFSTNFNVSNFYSYHGFTPMGIQSILTALPIAGVIYSFIGFNPAVQLAAEVKDPKTAIPFAIIGSLLICIVLYTAIQIAFIGALHVGALQHGWQKLSFVGDAGPFAGMMIGLGMIWFVKLLYFDAVISPFGTALVQAAATGRMTYAMSQNHYFPNYFMRLNKHHAPIKAMLLNLIVGLLFLLPFPNWQKMVGFLVSCLVFGYVVGPMSLIAIRKDKKTTLLCLVAFYICNLIIYWTGWSVIAKVSIAFAIGYLLLIAYMSIPSIRAKLNLDIKKGWWVIPYIVGLVLISYCGSFGGGMNIIKFGWDFAVIIIFTIIIFYIAKSTVNITTISAL